MLNEENDLFELEITGMTHEGLGVGKRWQGCFCNGAIDGETVLAKVIKQQRNMRSPKRKVDSKKRGSARTFLPGV